MLNNIIIVVMNYHDELLKSHLGSLVVHLSSAVSVRVYLSYLNCYPYHTNLTTSSLKDQMRLHLIKIYRRQIFLICPTISQLLIFRFKPSFLVLKGTMYHITTEFGSMISYPAFLILLIYFRFIWYTFYFVSIY